MSGLPSLSWIMSHSESPDIGKLLEFMQEPEMQQLMHKMNKNTAVKAFQQMYEEELQHDPKFLEMIQELRQPAGGDPPQTIQQSFLDVLNMMISNRKFVKKVEQFNKEYSPEMKNVSHALDKVAAAAAEDFMGDPQSKGFMDLMKAGKIADAMAFIQGRPDLMAKCNAAVSKAIGTLDASWGHAAAGEQEEELVNLHTAASEGEPLMVKRCLEAGADVDEQDVAGRTPLHGACGYGELECARLLLEAGACVDAVDNIANTALHYAAGYGQVEAVELLLKHKAGVLTKNQDGCTPLQVATLNKHAEVVALLKKAQPPMGLGASLRPRKKEGVRGRVRGPAAGG